MAFLKKRDGRADESQFVDSVLLGYWCALFKSLVDTHAREVFCYLYQHTATLQTMIEHMYSPQMCEIIVKLLNFNASVFQRHSAVANDSDSDDDELTPN